jgi:hypothetical protein
MRDWYDRPQLEDVLAEQAERLPNGALGYLEPPEVEMLGMEGIPNEALSLLQSYLKGEVPTMEFMNRIESIRISSLVPKI